MSTGTLLQAATATAWSLGWQAASAALLCGLVAAGLDLCRDGRGGRYRRRTAAWRRAFGRQLRTAAPAVAVALAVGGMHGLASGRLPQWEPFRLVLPGLFLALALPATAGCLLVLDAGRQEARGRLRPARRQARAGGKAMALGVGALLLGAAAGLAWLPAEVRGAVGTSAPGAAALLVLGGVAIGLGGLVGLLAGLAGKPRPSGGVAALLYVAGLVTWFAVAAEARVLVVHAGS